jgi:hypothetical protein
LTTQDGKSAKRPHQAFLLLQDPSKKLDVSYPFSVKESGKAKLELVGHRTMSERQKTSVLMIMLSRLTRISLHNSSVPLLPFLQASSLPHLARRQDTTAKHSP